MNFEKQVYTFITELQQFEYELKYLDRYWTIIFSDKKEKWHHASINKYKDIYYISLLDGDVCGLEVKQHKSIEAMASFGFSHHYDGRDDLPSAWGELISALRRWLKFVKKDWIKANKYVQQNYPLKYRKGKVPNAVVRESIRDIYRLDQKLGKAKTKKFIGIVESEYFHKKENTERKTMSAKDFFDYCKIAYTAARESEPGFDKHLTGREMYERYADGRDEGLLSIRENSKKAFAEWIDGEHPKRETGGHPWEIMRGGNTTHIDLIVKRPSYYLKEGFEVLLRAPAITRLSEAINMFLALFDAGLPISICDYESIRKRLLAQDNIGIMPCYASLHRGNQSFYEHEEVYDVCYFDDFGRYKPRVKAFATWEPLPILKRL